MRLAEGIIIDQQATFGKLRFSALRRESFVRDSDGELTTEVKGRTYDIKSAAQKRMIQITLPPEVDEKKFEFNEIVQLVNPVVDTVANPTYRGADVDWYIKADDIVSINHQKAEKQSENRPQNQQQKEK